MVSNWRILAIFLPVTVTAFAGTSAFAQMSDEALRAMIVGQTYTMTQPKAAAGTLSAAEQARQQAELGARYAEATKATAGKSLASPMPRPAFADQVEVLNASSAKAQPGRLSDEQKSALLKDIAREMSKRPAFVSGTPSSMSADDFENMKRNLERLRK